MLDTNLTDIQLKTTEGLLVLNSVKGVGRVCIEKLLSNFESIGDILDADDEILKIAANSKQRLSLRDTDSLSKAYIAALKEIERCDKLGGSIFSMYGDGYPQRLLSLEEPPFLLYATGELSILSSSVAFVGTREPTEFGGKVAHAMASAFASDGWCVVSGLARGIDSICHNAAVDAGGTTCAVLASGLDVYTSPQAMQLAKRICDNGGVVVSEFAFGTQANRGSYIDRDRLITGLSLATVFVQGEYNSGSMHSVRYAVAQDKPIFVPAIPERFQSEEINDTARDLARIPLGQFAAKAEWNGSSLEKSRIEPHRNVAQAISGRDQYPFVFEQLRAMEAQIGTQKPMQSPMLAMA